MRKITIQTKLGIFSELLFYLWQRKMWWIIPLVIILLLLVAVLAVESTAGIAPFIYTFI